MLWYSVPRGTLCNSVWKPPAALIFPSRPAGGASREAAVKRVNVDEPLTDQDRQMIGLFFAVPERYRADAQWWVTDEGERQLKELADRPAELP